MNVSTSRSWARLFTLGAVIALVVAGWPAVDRAGGQTGGPAKIDGIVQIDRDPSSNWTVELHASGPNGTELMDSGVSDDEGRFRLNARPAVKNADVRYVLATRGTSDKMLVALGLAAEMPADIVVNELTTIASIWTNAQFIDGDSIAGNPVGVVAASRNVPNLVDLSTGELARVVLNTANLRTNTAATMASLAGLMSDCLTDGCDTLFGCSTPPGADTPTDTLGAFHNIALNPWSNVTEIFSLLQPATDGGDNPPYLPTLVFPPTAWTLSLVYTEGGFNAPGGLSADAEGNIWANNNFMVGSQSVLFDAGGHFAPDPDGYAGDGVVKLSSNGIPLSPRTGFRGGGLFGAAFGLAIDQDGAVWVGSFGGNSLTKLRANGTPISPSSPCYSSRGGYHHRGFASPQSNIVTADGSIWVTNIADDTVSQLVDGDPNPRTIRTWGGDDCAHQFSSPWGLANDTEGNVYVSNLLGRSVSMINPDTAPGSLCPSETYLLDARALPQGIATDMDGNVWVADTYGGGKVDFLDASNGYVATSFTADDTIVGPWGVAVDGANNPWVADFFGKRIEQLCGASGDCPEGMQELGSRISPPGIEGSGSPGKGGGYGANGALQSITSIIIDQAGNVWAANNFDDVRVCLRGAGIPDPTEGGSTVELEKRQTQCGGNGAVVMFGIAAPVAAPLIGPPTQP